MLYSERIVLFHRKAFAACPGLVPWRSWTCMLRRRFPWSGTPAGTSQLHLESAPHLLGMMYAPGLYVVDGAQQCY